MTDNKQNIIEGGVFFYPDPISYTRPAPNNYFKYFNVTRETKI